MFFKLSGKTLLHSLNILVRQNTALLANIETHINKFCGSVELCHFTVLEIMCVSSREITVMGVTVRFVMVSSGKL